MQRASHPPLGLRLRTPGRLRGPVSLHPMSWAAFFQLRSTFGKVCGRALLGTIAGAGARPDRSLARGPNHPPVRVVILRRYGSQCAGHHRERDGGSRRPGRHDRRFWWYRWRQHSVAAVHALCIEIACRSWAGGVHGDLHLLIPAVETCGDGDVPDLGVSMAGAAVTLDLFLLLLYLDRFVHALRPWLWSAMADARSRDRPRHGRPGIAAATQH